MQSDLDTITLGDIWSLSDVDQDGMMDVGEYILAKHLIAHVVCRTHRDFASHPSHTQLEGNPLPETLPADINPKVVQPLPSPNAEVCLCGAAFAPTRAQSTEKFAELFQKFVESADQLMSPSKAHAILLKSKLPKLVLAQIWKLADADQCANPKFRRSHSHPTGTAS